MSSAFSKSSVFVCTHELVERSASSLNVFIRYVWTEALSEKKKLRFQMKTDACGVDRALVNRLTKQPFVLDNNNNNNNNNNNKG